MLMNLLWRSQWFAKTVSFYQKPHISLVATSTTHKCTSTSISTKTARNNAMPDSMLIVFYCFPLQLDECRHQKKKKKSEEIQEQNKAYKLEQHANSPRSNSKRSQIKANIDYIWRIYLWFICQTEIMRGWKAPNREIYYWPMAHGIATFMKLYSNFQFY